MFRRYLWAGHLQQVELGRHLEECVRKFCSLVQFSDVT
jgi:hypothetical protein